MKYIYSCFVFFVSSLFCVETLQAQAGFDDQIEQFATDLTGKIVASEKKKIAVAAFAEIDGTVTQLGDFLTDELSAQLAVYSENQTKFEVIERANLEQIFMEHKLAMSGIIDGTTAKELGKIKAADAIVVGTITPMSETYKVTIKVLDTEFGNIVTSSKGQIVKTPSLQALQDKIVDSPKEVTPPKTTDANVDNKPKTQINLSHPHTKGGELEGVICFNNYYKNTTTDGGRNVTITLINKITKKRYFIDVDLGGDSCIYVPYGMYNCSANYNGTSFMITEFKVEGEEIKYISIQ